jgi:hypothetical protein
VTPPSRWHSPQPTEKSHSLKNLNLFLKTKDLPAFDPSTKGINEHNVLKKHIFRAVPGRGRPAAKTLRRSSDGRPRNPGDAGQTK